MHIKEITFENFKSFGRKVTIPFYEGFTTISGPNGSGKSNIIDGILFVLALSTTRTMRAEKLTDLIFKGEKADRQPKYTQVTLLFDNTNREMPIDTDEVKIARKVKVAKNGYYSYYYLNDKACQLGDIHAQLSKARVTPEGYNVVMQGDVMEIINMTPFERRKIIDEIAGVTEFDNKTDRAKNELEIVWDRTERVNIIIDEVNTQLKKLETERDHALKYQSLQKERHKYEGYAYLAKLKDSIAEQDKIVGEMEKLTQRTESLKQTLEEKNTIVAERKSRLDELNSQIMQKGEEEQLQIKKEIEELKGKISYSSTLINSAKAEIEKIDARRRQILIDIDSKNGEITQMQEKISEETLRYEGVESEIREQKTKLMLIKSKIAEIDVKFVKTRDALSTVRGEIEATRDEKNELMREQDRLIDAARRKESEISDMNREVEEAKLKSKDVDADIQDVEAEVEEFTSTIKSHNKDLSDLESNRSQIKSVVSDLEENLREAQSEYAMAAARIRATKEVGSYSNSVDAVLKAKESRQLPGIYGTVAQLGKVQGEYTTALGIAAGGGMQNVIVDSDEDAARGINYLKRNKFGRVTFLPMNKMRTGSVPPLPKLDGVIDYAIDLVDFDPKFYPAFWHIFRDTLIVDDLTTARKLMGSKKIVTLDGDSVGKSGSMTGGSINKGRSISFAAAEEEKVTKYAEIITEYEARRTKAIEKLDAVDGQLAKVNRDIAECEKEISIREMQIEEIRGRESRLKELIETSTTRISEIEAERETMRQKMKDVTSDIQEKESEIDELDVKVTALENELSGSEVPKLNADADRVESEISRLNERLRDITAEIKSIGLELEYANNKISDGRTQIKEMDESKTAHRTSITECKESTETAQSELDGKEVRIKELEDELFELKNERKKASEMFEIESAQAQRTATQLERMDNQIQALVATEKALIVQIESLKKEIEERNISIKEADEEDNREGAGDEEEDPDEDEYPSSESVRLRLESIHAAMTALEPVNMLAIAEYDAVIERLSELTSRRDVLIHEREEILSRIEKYAQHKKKLFMESFDAINENFKTIFAELSEGTGDLMLEDEEDPFAGGLTIRAQPKDKTLQRMESLSGGEKSLTSMTLLFAIQRYRPAPFYAFDEVDMNLDGINAEKMAKRIKEASKTAQFIVVSLRKPMIEAANRTVGVAMQENNITSITGVVLH